MTYVLFPRKVVDKRVSIAEMKIMANGHFTRQSLQKQLVALCADPEVTDWGQLVFKYGVTHTSLDRLDGVIKALGLVHATRTRGPGWFNGKGSIEAHPLVKEYLKNIVDHWEINVGRSIPPSLGHRVEFGLNQGGRGLDGKVNMLSMVSQR